MIMWIAICAFGLAVTLVSERFSRKLPGAIGKFVAASAYIGAALSMGAADTDYGRVLLIGMAFCWVGDLFLVSNHSRKLFLLGLGSFLLGHVAYIGAFAVRGISVPAVLVAGVVMAVFAAIIMRWLKRSLDDRMRLPVWGYVIAISVMMAVAVGTYAVDGNWAIPLGALSFLLSDLSVARDRFVSPDFVNRAWGLPLYFFAQMVLAFSVGFQ